MKCFCADPLQIRSPNIVLHLKGAVGPAFEKRKQTQNTQTKTTLSRAFGAEQVRDRVHVCCGHFPGGANNKKHESRQDNIDRSRNDKRRGTATYVQTATSGAHGPKSERQPEKPMVAVEDEIGD